MTSPPKIHEFAGGTVHLDEYGDWHRLDGPAYHDRLSGVKEWYINDWCIDDVIKPWAKDMNIDLDNLSEEDKVIIAMVWGDYNGGK